MDEDNRNEKPVHIDAETNIDADSTSGIDTHAHMPSKNNRTFSKDVFPKELTALNQWVCWRLEPDKKSGRDTKVPYSPLTGRRASISNSATWGSFEDAVHSFEKYAFSGIGFVFTAEAGIIGIDIDKCLSVDVGMGSAGEPNEIAKAILAKAPATFIEYSPSGRGLHIFLKGKLPSGGKRNSESGVEIYSASRYFTMTGNRWHNCVDVIAEDNGVVEFIYENSVVAKRRKQPEQTDASVSSDSGNSALVGAIGVVDVALPSDSAGSEGVPGGVLTAVAEVLSDENLMKLALSSKDKDAFTKLHRGEWQEKYKSQSEADFAFCCKLAFWSGRNEVQIDRIFRSSGLYREKWDAQHSSDGSTYGMQTVRNACAATKQTYTPPQSGRGGKGKKGKGSGKGGGADGDGAEGFNESGEPEIFMLNGSYFRSKGEKFYQITNFTAQPIEMLTYDEGAQITANFITNKGEVFLMHLESTAMSDLRTFKSVIFKKTFALTFLGGSGDLDQFKMFMYDKLDWVKKRGAKAIGIYPREQGRSLVFVDSKGAVGAGGKADHSIVQLENFKVIESDILSAPLLDKAGLIEIARHIFSYNEPAKTVPILAWAAGCFIKPHLRKNNVKFPHLFLVGERGGGKSNSMERVILPMVGQMRKYAVSQVTQFGLMKEANSSNVIPTLIEEFKPSTMKQSQVHILYNHIRDSYDCHKGIRGRPDQSVIFYDLLAPMAIAGEESADESAIRERSIELLFSKRDLKNDDYQESFSWICKNEPLVRSLGRSLLDTALRVTQKDVAGWYEEGDDFFTANLPSRIRSNLCAMYAGVCLIGKLCSVLGVSFTDTFPFDNEECAKYLESSVREYLLDDSSFNKGIIENTFEVMARMKLKQGDDYCFENNEQYLIISLSDVYDRYTRYLKDYAIKGESLEYKQFCKQLRKTEYCVKPTSFKKRMAKESKWVWMVDFHKLAANCDVAGFVREVFEDE